MGSKFELTLSPWVSKEFAAIVAKIGMEGKIGGESAHWLNAFYLKPAF
jgi:hypothetical protein